MRDQRVDGRDEFFRDLKRGVTTFPAGLQLSEFVGGVLAVVMTRQDRDPVFVPAIGHSLLGHHRFLRRRLIARIAGGRGGYAVTTKYEFGAESTTTMILSHRPAAVCPTTISDPLSAAVRS